MQILRAPDFLVATTTLYWLMALAWLLGRWLLTLQVVWVPSWIFLLVLWVFSELEWLQVSRIHPFLCVQLQGSSQVVVQTHLSVALPLDQESTDWSVLVTPLRRWSWLEVVPVHSDQFHVLCCSSCDQGKQFFIDDDKFYWVFVATSWVRDNNCCRRKWCDVRFVPHDEGFWSGC